MWQSLCESLDDRQRAGFTVVAVALDQPEAARPWIEAAKPTFPCLIDRDHRLAELYHFTNVPQAVWIDERGQLVRPPENAGSTDGFRRMNRQTGEMPAEAMEERLSTKQRYAEAVTDWAVNGEKSRHALPPDVVAERLQVPDGSIAQAHALFRLAQVLRRDGNADEARRHFAEAARLHPDSWAMWRQGAEKNEQGLATGSAFWERVDALGSKPYHRLLDLDGAGGADRSVDDPGR